MISIKTEYDMFAEITLAIDRKTIFVNSELQNSRSNVLKADNTILCIYFLSGNFKIIYILK